MHCTTAASLEMSDEPKKSVKEQIRRISLSVINFEPGERDKGE